MQKNDYIVIFSSRRVIFSQGTDNKISIFPTMWHFVLLIHFFSQHDKQPAKGREGALWRQSLTSLVHWVDKTEPSPARGIHLFAEQRLHWLRAAKSVQDVDCSPVCKSIVLQGQSRLLATPTPCSVNTKHQLSLNKKIFMWENFSTAKSGRTTNLAD